MLNQYGLEDYGCQVVIEQQRPAASRPYRMRKRAEQADDTRRRIVEATVDLHGRVGPAATTVAAIADQAGVTRPTVYRHFPDDEALFAACSAHWLAGQRPPDPDRWATIAAAEERLRAGLADLYRFYRQGDAMLTGVHRDRPFLPASIQRSLDDEARHHRDVLLEAFVASGARRRRVRGLIGHAVSFWTWQSLCAEQGLSNREAVEAMVDLVLNATP